MTPVAIFQYRLLHYRVPFFERLAQRLRPEGVELLVVHGQASPEERARRDEGSLPGALVVHNRFLRVGGKDLVWQPVPAAARGAALSIVMQENRILSNYLLQARRQRGGPLVGLWGHGRNLQSRAPGGWRERWKRHWLHQADWWFAYTGGTARYVASTGYPADRITNVENAIDDGGFRADLAAVVTALLARARADRGIAEGAPVALYCGSLYPDKRIDLLLDSAARLAARMADFHLLVVGDGPTLPQVRAAAASRPWLHVAGALTGVDKALHFRLAQVVLNPGAVGLHVVDSFVAGTPLLTQASALHGPEIDYLEDGVNGVVVASDSAEDYAQAVEHILREPAGLARLREACAAGARRYTIDNMVEHFAAGILRCLQRPPHDG